MKNKQIAPSLLIMVAVLQLISLAGDFFSYKAAKVRIDESELISRSAPKLTAEMQDRVNTWNDAATEAYRRAMTHGTGFILICMALRQLRRIKS